MIKKQLFQKYDLLTNKIFNLRDNMDQAFNYAAEIRDALDDGLYSKEKANINKINNLLDKILSQIEQRLKKIIYKDYHDADWDLIDYIRTTQEKQEKIKKGN